MVILETPLVQAGRKDEFLNLVKFYDIRHWYSLEEDITLEFTLDPKVKGSSKDWIGLFREDWDSFESFITFRWGFGKAINPQTPRRRQQTIYLPADLIDSICWDYKYQFVYVDKYLDVLGQSPLFRFTYPIKRHSSEARTSPESNRFTLHDEILMSENPCGRRSMTTNCRHPNSFHRTSVTTCNLCQPLNSDHFEIKEKTEYCYQECLRISERLSSLESQIAAQSTLINRGIRSLNSVTDNRQDTCREEVLSREANIKFTVPNTCDFDRKKVDKSEEGFDVGLTENAEESSLTKPLASGTSSRNKRFSVQNRSNTDLESDRMCYENLKFKTENFFKTLTRHEKKQSVDFANSDNVSDSDMFNGNSEMSRNSDRRADDCCQLTTEDGVAGCGRKESTRSAMFPRPSCCIDIDLFTNNIDGARRSISEDRLLSKEWTTLSDLDSPLILKAIIGHQEEKIRKLSRQIEQRCLSSASNSGSYLNHHNDDSEQDSDGDRDVGEDVVKLVRTEQKMLAQILRINSNCEPYANQHKTPKQMW